MPKEQEVERVPGRGHRIISEVLEVKCQTVGLGGMRLERRSKLQEPEVGGL